MSKKLHIALVAGAAVAALALPSTASADAGCDLVVATNGSDSAAGTVAEPLRSAAVGADHLSSGETLCFRSGTHQFDSFSIRAADATVTSFPGERATLHGPVRVERTASGAVIENVVLDGPREDIFSPLIYADRVVLRDNEITNDNSSNCVHLANYYDAPAPRDVLIEGNRIHDCGKLPAQNHDHGIYVAASRNLIIRDNVIYDNADRGIQLFPDAQGTLIEGNVIDGNGQGIIFSGYEGLASNDTTVVHNLITNSNVRHNVESFYPDDTPAGRNNVVRENCIHNADGWYDEADGSGIASEIGFDATNNVIADPRYIDRAAGNFGLEPGSPCAGVLEGGAAPQLSLEAVKATVRPGQKTILRGRAPRSLNAKVWIFKKVNGNWQSLKRADLSGSFFKAKVRIHSRSQFKARAQGVRDSAPVSVAASKSKG